MLKIQLYKYYSQLYKYKKDIFVAISTQIKYSKYLYNNTLPNTMTRSVTLI